MRLFAVTRPGANSIGFNAMVGVTTNSGGGGGGGGMTPPTGFQFLLGADGAFLTGADGAFLLGVAQ